MVRKSFYEDRDRVLRSRPCVTLMDVICGGGCVIWGAHIGGSFRNGTAFTWGMGVANVGSRLRLSVSVCNVRTVGTVGYTYAPPLIGEKILAVLVVHSVDLSVHAIFRDEGEKEELGEPEQKKHTTAQDQTTPDKHERISFNYQSLSAQRPLGNDRRAREAQTCTFAPGHAVTTGRRCGATSAFRR
jgi:hypothetical protein